MPAGAAGCRASGLPLPGLGLHGHLAAIRPHFPAALVPERAAHRIASLPSGLPPFRHSVTECRLGPVSDQVDFAWKYTLTSLTIITSRANSGAG